MKRNYNIPDFYKFPRIKLSTSSILHNIHFNSDLLYLYAPEM